jgi:tetratricopeptide (TPR) repeat protein
MQISLNTSVRKYLLGGAALVLAGLYLVLCGSFFLASWFGSRPELTSLRRAVRFDPGNADYRNHLGRYYELAARDPATAIEHYSAAVGLNPHSARFWFDLASAYQVMGDTAHQVAAQARALTAGPTSPDVAWEAANLYLVQGENEKALREFRVVLDNDNSLTAAAVQFCWRIEPDVDALLSDVIPPRSEAYLALLDLLTTRQQKDALSDPGLSQQELAATEKVWAALIKSNQPFEKRRAWDYFDYLVRQKDIDEAVEVWRQTVPRFGLSPYLPSSANLIVNPHFSLAVMNSGMDWRYQKQSGVEVTLDRSQGHDGSPSVQVNFDGPGISDAGLIQLVPVQPGASYNFSAYYKTADLQGAGGPHLTVQDMYDPKIVYFDSEEMKDANYWQQVEGQFTAGADSKLVVLHVRRLPAGSPIRGKLWVDDFRLTRK